MRAYTLTSGYCPACDQNVPLYRKRIATHGWPTCAGTGEAPAECEECGDAAAVSEALFNGATRMKLCEGCHGWWVHHGLDVAYVEGEA